MLSTKWLLLPGVVCAASIAFAQDPVPSVRRIRIETTLDSTVTRKTQSGDESASAAGRGMLADGKTTIARRQTVAFEERGDGTRHYLQVQSDETTQTDDAEPRANHVDGALESRTVVPVVDDQGGASLLEVIDGERVELAPELVEGVPGTIDLAVLVPPSGNKAGESFEPTGDVRAALRRLLHPVTAESRRGRGRGGRGFGRGPTERQMLGAFTALLAVADAEVETRAESVAAADGHGPQVKLRLVVKAKGNAQQLGLAAPTMFGGRGPRGGGASGDAEARLTLDVVVQLDDSGRQVRRIDLTGKLEADAKSTLAARRGGTADPTTIGEQFASTIAVKFVESAGG
ncbi:MAG: hypothetical protein U1F36_16755 [Planctomycetota bacterium]